MNVTTLEWLLQQFHWQLSLASAAGIFAVTFLGSRLMMLVPAFGEASRLNRETFNKKMWRPAYAANHKWNRKWGAVYMVVIFGLILPFCVTLELKPWWAMVLDVVVILMFYDFFYYLVHRFLFHDGGLGGPLLSVHAIHHQQHNPCRMDWLFGTLDKDARKAAAKP